jgi:drug/metabolite transporter (DMT)-like permease
MRFLTLLPPLLLLLLLLQAYCFLGERWGPMGWCGAAVILIASIATQLGGAMDDDKPGDKDQEARATS